MKLITYPKSIWIIWIILVTDAKTHFKKQAKLAAVYIIFKDIYYLVFLLSVLFTQNITNNDI